MSHAAASVHSDNCLRQRWALLHSNHPQIRIRDAARQLEASEAQLVATGCGDTVVRLTNHWRELIQRLALLGRVMALTRNEHAVHEQQGTYSNVCIMGQLCAVEGDGINLQLSLAHWYHGFAVREMTLSGPRRSLQFFDRHGSAVHKIYLTDDGDLAAYDGLVQSFRSQNQAASLQVTSTLPAEPSKSGVAVDVDDFRAHWDKLRGSSAFPALLGQFGLTRLQALRLAGGNRAWRVAISSLRQVLESARSIRLPIRIKVGNRGALQIHTGPIHSARPVGSWYSVLDADFNLHVRDAAADSAWVVRRPTVEGAISGSVTSLELFDASGDTIVRVLGSQRPVIPEDLAWRRMVTALAPL